MFTYRHVYIATCNMDASCLEYRATDFYAYGGDKEVYFINLHTTTYNIPLYLCMNRKLIFIISLLLQFS